MTYSYALSIDYSKNPYYADNPAMFMLLLSRVVNNQQHYAPIKAANRPLREWMDYATSKLGLHRAKSQAFVILNGMTKLPHCKRCGRELSDHNVKSIKHGFTDFCCNKCSARWHSENWSDDDHVKLSHAVKNAYASMTIERRDEIRAACRQAACNPSVRQRRIESLKKTLANRTSEERALASRRISEAYHSMPEEKKALRRERQSYSLQHMDAQRKEHRNNLIKQKNRQSWLNRSEEEKEAYRQTRRTAALNRPQEAIERMVAACNKTKKKNKSFSTSKPEEDAFYMLVDAFGVDSVIRQYKCSRYPFNCDFYVKPLDLFIECNYFWQHGRHPFDNASKADIAILEKWKSKCRKHNAYERAIYVWTQLDVRKQQTAEDNKLNYKAFYEVEDFNRWAKSIIKVGRKGNEEVI